MARNTHILSEFVVLQQPRNPSLQLMCIMDYGESKFFFLALSVTPPRFYFIALIAMIPSDYGSHAAHVCSNKECLATAALRVTLPRIGVQFDWSIDGVEISHDSSRAPELAIQRIFPPTTTTFSLFPRLSSRSFPL